MSKHDRLRTWAWVHKWSSLVCTLFLLILCVTGLPLIFHDEIESLLGETQAPAMPADTPRASLDRVAAAARAYYPGQVIQFLSWDPDEPHLVFAGMNRSLDAPPSTRKSLVLDDRTAKVLDAPDRQSGFLYLMLQIHTDLFAGLPGKLFLGAMGLLFVAAIVSGVVLYRPFMRKLAFGTVRRERSPRIKWLDLHNLLGIAALVWIFVVGVTGVINTLSDLMVVAWQKGQLAEMVAPYAHAPLPTAFSSIEQAVRTAERAAPDMTPQFIGFPGTRFTSPHHYAVFMHGNTPLTSRLLMPALIDAQTGKLTDMRAMPWYVQTLFLSEPLHFGDYGGLPLKLLWTACAWLTLFITGNGAWLWWSRRRRKRRPEAAAEGAA